MLSQQPGDVRERPGRAEHDARPEPFRQERHGVLVDRPCSRLGQRRPVEPTLAVHVIGDAELPDEGTLGATRHGHIGAAGELEHLERVQRRLLERLVAVDGRDAEQLDLRAGEREQDGDRVVVARVAVEDDRRRHARSIVQPRGRRSRQAAVVRPRVPRRVPRSPMGRGGGEGQREDLRLPRADLRPSA